MFFLRILARKGERLTKLASLNRAVYGYSKDLRVKKSIDDIYCIYKQELIPEAYRINGSWLIYQKPIQSFVMALTEDWSLRSKRCEWGIEPVMARLRAIDLWSNHNFIDEIIDSHQKSMESKKRDFKNNTESFLYDFHSEFKKTFAYTNVSSLKKIDRRRLDDKRPF